MLLRIGRAGIEGKLDFTFQQDFRTIDQQGGLASGHLYLSQGAERYRVFHFRGGRFADQHGHAQFLGEPFEARSQIDRVADRRELGANLRADTSHY